MLLQEIFRNSKVFPVCYHLSMKQTCYFIWKIPIYILFLIYANKVWLQVSSGYGDWFWNNPFMLILFEHILLYIYFEHKFLKLTRFSPHILLCSVILYLFDNISPIHRSRHIQWSTWSDLHVYILFYVISYESHPKKTATKTFTTTDTTKMQRIQKDKFLFLIQFI